ncbi:MAG: cyclodehydratase [Microthrixaceae bacterium]
MRTALAATCQASAAGTTSNSPFNSGVTYEGPTTVAAGSNFQVKLTADPVPVPTTAGGYNINNLRDLVIRFKVPAGAQFVGATLAGGANLGNRAAPSVALNGPNVQLTVPGYLAPGSNAVLPTVTATLKATGAAGTVLPAQLAGTSYGDPGISFTANVTVLFFGVDAPTNCYVPTNPVLGSVTIV